MVPGVAVPHPTVPPGAQSARKGLVRVAQGLHSRPTVCANPRCKCLRKDGVMSPGPRRISRRKTTLEFKIIIRTPKDEDLLARNCKEARV